MPVLSLFHTSLNAITNLLRQKCDQWFFWGGGQKSCPRNPKVHSSKGEEQRQFCSMSCRENPKGLEKCRSQAHKTDRTGVLSLKCPQLTDLAVSHFRGPLQPEHGQMPGSVRIPSSGRNSVRQNVGNNFRKRVDWPKADPS
jgi:hypothetical protein